jgi:translation initiation factor 1
MTRLVYSSGPGGADGRSVCPRCATRPCRCPIERLPAPSAQKVLVRCERAGRRGKTVTVARPLLLERAAAEDLLAELKRRCGAGGALKTVTTEDGRTALALELQGDHVDGVVARLVELGFVAKR